MHTKVAEWKINTENEKNITAVFVYFGTVGFANVCVFSISRSGQSVRVSARFFFHRIFSSFVSANRTVKTKQTIF